MVDELLGSASVERYPVRAVRFGLGASIVVSGLLRYFLSAADGRQITIRYVGPGDLVGSVIPLSATGSTGAQAIEPSVVMVLDPGRLQTVVFRHPESFEALIDEMTGRLRTAYGVLAARSFATVKSRIARDLIERARAGGHPEPAADLQVTQQALADATGSVREVVARSLAEMRRQGIVATHPSHVTILDADALAREARAEGAGEAGLTQAQDVDRVSADSPDHSL
ncbi:MAG TPA: Crp/Fnr family transcriptional regulator [Candidatus Dormibacteraeota bacterium]